MRKYAELMYSLPDSIFTFTIDQFAVKNVCVKNEFETKYW